MVGRPRNNAAKPAKPMAEKLDTPKKRTAANLITKPRAQKGPKVYVVTVAGQFYDVGGLNNKVTLAEYSETRRLNERHREAGFLSVFKNHILPTALAKKHPGFNGIHTHHIVSVVDEQNPGRVTSDPDLMNLSELMTYIRYNELEIEINLYNDVDALREALKAYIEDPQSFLDAQDKRKELKGDALALISDLADLNEGEGVATLEDEELEEVDPDSLPDEVVPASKKGHKMPQPVPTEEFDEEDLAGDI